MDYKKRSLAGQAYICDDSLYEEQKKCRKIIQKLNTHDCSDFGGLHRIVKELFGKCDEDTFVNPPFHCDYGYNIHIGSHFYANTGCVMLDCGKIIIGNHVFLAPHVQLYTVNHPIHLKQRDADYEYTKPITIKDHVWIGGNTTVLPGVTIGENSIIGAGSVVTKDIPANVIAVGMVLL